MDILKSKSAKDMVETLLADKKTINGIDFIAAHVPDASADTLKSMGDALKNKLETGVIVLASENDGKASMLAMATDSAVSRGINCGNIIKSAASCCSGGGGGKPQMATAGGKDASKICEALQAAEDVFVSQIK